jgi:hypothetical protein
MTDRSPIELWDLHDRDGALILTSTRDRCVTEWEARGGHGAWTITRHVA